MTRMNQYYDNKQSDGCCNPSSAIRLRPHVPEANRFDLPSFVLPPCDETVKGDQRLVHTTMRPLTADHLCSVPLV